MNACKFDVWIRRALRVWLLTVPFCIFAAYKAIDHDSYAKEFQKQGEHWFASQSKPESTWIFDYRELAKESFQNRDHSKNSRDFWVIAGIAISISPWVVLISAKSAVWAWKGSR